MRHELYYTDIETGERKPTEEVRMILLDHVEPYFDKDIHSKVMEKYPEPEIEKLLNRKVKFFEQNQDDQGIRTSPNDQSEELDDEYSEELEDDYYI